MTGLNHIQLPRGIQSPHRLHTGSVTVKNTIIFHDEMDAEKSTYSDQPIWLTPESFLLMARHLLYSTIWRYVVFTDYPRWRVGRGYDALGITGMTGVLPSLEPGYTAPAHGV